MRCGKDKKIIWNLLIVSLIIASIVNVACLLVNDKSQKLLEPTYGFEEWNYTIYGYEQLNSTENSTIEVPIMRHYNESFCRIELYSNSSNPDYIFRLNVSTEKKSYKPFYLNLSYENYTYNCYGRFIGVGI